MFNMLVFEVLLDLFSFATRDYQSYPIAAVHFWPIPMQDGSQGPLSSLRKILEKLEGEILLQTAGEGYHLSIHPSVCHHHLYLYCPF